MQMRVKSPLVNADSPAGQLFTVLLAIGFAIVLCVFPACKARVADEVYVRRLPSGLAEHVSDPGYFLGEPRFDLDLIFSEGRGYGIEVAMDGTVLVNTRTSGLKRSKNGGRTWQAFDGPAGGVWVVDEESGDIMILDLGTEGSGAYANPVDFSDPSKGYRFRLMRSRDHGETWESETAIIYSDELGYLPGTGGAENGVTLKFGRYAGRLLVPARVFVNYENSTNLSPHFVDNYNSSVYSDDGGATWHASSPFPVSGTGEGALAEISDGRVYYNSRSHVAEDAKRREAWSYDGGATWQDLQVSVLPDRSGSRNFWYGCKGGLIRLPIEGHDILIYSNIDVPKTGMRERQNVTVWASFDGAETWPVKRSVYSGFSGYSSLSAGRPGTPSEGWIYMAFEGGPRSETLDEDTQQGIRDHNIARFNLSWILEGELTGDGELPQWTVN